MNADELAQLWHDEHHTWERGCCWCCCWECNPDWNEGDGVNPHFQRAAWALSREAHGTE